MTEVIDRQTLKALSTDTRQEILKRLSKRPYTASELSKLLDKHVTTITEHLSVLERSGIVRKKESTNKWVYYVLSEKGEKFFKPYYSWVLMLSISLVAFVVGVSQFFTGYTSSTFSAGETLKSTAQDAAPAIAQTTETVQTYDTGLIVGTILVIAALVLLWYAFRKRNRRQKEKVKILGELMSL